MTSLSFPSPCSNSDTLVPAVYTIEGGAKTIKNILKKQILCHHDVTNLTEAYQKIEKLEQNGYINLIQNSKTILFDIIQKIEAIRYEDKISAEHIINTYHLQQFKKLPIKKTFDAFFIPENTTLKIRKDIATCIPFCGAEEDFNVHLQALLGKSPHIDITKIIQERKRTFYTQQLKNERGSKYPHYLDEILNGKFFHLYDHLITMKNLSTRDMRNTQLKELSFSSFAQIILDFKKAILIQMEKIIPQENSNIVFLLGNTGSGKSTTFCYLRGDTMQLNGTAYQSLNESNIIGDDPNNSFTLFPNVVSNSNFTFVDFPGFDDSHGNIISFAIKIVVKALVKKYSPKIVLLMPLIDAELTNSHSHALNTTMKVIFENLNHCILGITKYSQISDVSNIINTKKDQEKERSQPNLTKDALENTIKTLSSNVHQDPGLQVTIDALKEDFKNFYDTSGYEKALKIKEDLIIKKFESIKEDNVIRLVDLTDQGKLDDIFKTLELNTKVASISISKDLDSGDKDLLEYFFKNKLISVIQANKNIAPHIALNTEFFKNIEDFKRNVLATSLISTLLSKSHPEVGEFFHLEEIKPDIVYTYDKEIIKDCINEYIGQVICAIIEYQPEVDEIKNRCSSLIQGNINKEWGALRNYIIMIDKGLPPGTTSIALDKVWTDIRNEHPNRNDKKNKSPFAWLILTLLTIHLGIAYGIFDFLKKIKEMKKDEDLQLKIATDKLFLIIEGAKQAIETLKSIQSIVQAKCESKT